MLCRETLTKKGGFQQLIGATLRLACQQGLLQTSSRQVAIDSTGLESGHTSDYYSKRCKLHKHHYPKLSGVCDTQSHLFISAVADSGPKPDDPEFIPAVRQAYQQQPFAEIVADAGYDSERHHRLVRETLGAISIIPPLRSRPTTKLPSSPYRREMAIAFPHKRYNQRWQIESVFSQYKRVLGSVIRSRNYWSQCREVLLRVLTHNLMIIRRYSMFSTKQKAARFSSHSIMTGLKYGLGKTGILLNYP